MRCRFGFGHFGNSVLAPDVLGNNIYLTNIFGGKCYINVKSISNQSNLKNVLTCLIYMNARQLVRAIYYCLIGGEN